MFITIYEDENFLIPRDIEVTDFTGFKSVFSGAHSQSVDETPFLGHSGFSSPSPSWSVPDGTTLARNSPEGGLPSIYISERFFYIKPNMKVKVRFEKVDNTLYYNLVYYVNNTELRGFGDSQNYVPASSAYYSLHIGGFNVATTAQGESKIEYGFYLRIGDNVVKISTVSENYWDGSFRAHKTTASHAKGATPAGYSGGRADGSDPHVPSNAYANLSISSATGHGLHVYLLKDEDFSELMGEMWDRTLLGKVRNMIFKPTAGLLAAHRLPCGGGGSITEGVNICGERYISYLSVRVLESEQVFSFPPNDQLWEIDLSAKYEWSDSFLDFNPYVKALMWLPFVGSVPINVNYFAYGKVGVRYVVDAMTGNCLAEVFATDKDDKRLLVGRYAGNCASQLPITANDNGGFPILGAVTGAAVVAGAIASGGVGAAVAAGGTAGAAGAAAEGASLIAGTVGTKATVAGGVALAGKSLLKPHEMTMMGSLPSNISALAGDLCPFLYLFYAEDVTIFDVDGEDMHQKFDGYSASFYCTLGEIDKTGFVRGEFHADKVEKATSDEKNELEELLKEGVYL